MEVDGDRVGELDPVPDLAVIAVPAPAVAQVGEACGAAGVPSAVVVSAGNDATQRPIFPAAFAPYPGGSVLDEPDVIPVTTVGAMMPTTSTSVPTTPTVIR